MLRQRRFKGTTNARRPPSSAKQRHGKASVPDSRKYPDGPYRAFRHKRRSQTSPKRIFRHKKKGKSSEYLRELQSAALRSRGFFLAREAWRPSNKLFPPPPFPISRHQGPSELREKKTWKYEQKGQRRSDVSRRLSMAVTSGADAFSIAPWRAHADSRVGDQNFCCAWAGLAAPTSVFLYFSFSSLL